MSELPSRVRRAFRDHGSFEAIDDATWTSRTTAFDGEVTAETNEDGTTRFDVTVTVPRLQAATADEVADVVANGWFETFELRVSDIGGVARGDHEFDPTVTRNGEEIVSEFSLSDINERRGVDDAGAVIDFVEGTYVQGIIPGYEYVDPVDSLLSKARQQGNDGAV